MTRMAKTRARSRLEEAMKADLLAQNDHLQRKLNEIKNYIKAASADGWIGRDDPLFQEFNTNIHRHEANIAAFCSFDVEVISTHETRGVFQWVLRTIGVAKNDLLVKLELEITDRKTEASDMHNLLKSIKKTTEAAEKYSNFHDKLPKCTDVTIEALSIARNTSSEIISKMEKLDPGIFIRSRYMEYGDVIDGIHELFPSAVIAHAFNTMLMELEYLPKLPLIRHVRSLELDELIIGVLPGVVCLARQFAVVINKFYSKEVGRAFAEIANDRFRAAYILIRGVSTLYRARVFVDKPHLMVLRADEFASEHRLPQLSRNLHVFNNSDVLRRHKLGDCTSRLNFAVELCSSFILDNKATLEGLSSSTETISRTLCDADEDNHFVLNAKIIAMLNEDQDDVDFLENACTVTSVHDESSNSDVQYDDIIKELKRLPIKEMQLPYEESQEIASGSFGAIREVPWNDSKILVALKRFKVTPSERRTMKRLVREAKIMSSLQHDNVLSLFGYLHIPSESDESGDPEARFITYALVYPMYRRGSLQDYLKASHVKEKGKVKILVDIATAMAYLHKPQKATGVVVHGDLRAVSEDLRRGKELCAEHGLTYIQANVLITPNGEALLCDFGLSTHSNIDVELQTSSNATHPAWLAYEFFELLPPGQTVKLTVKTDVFAFGCVCYEVIYGETPYYECENDIIQINMRKIQRQPPNMDIPTSYRAQSHFKQLMEICWRVHPPRRPSASRLEHILRGLKDALL